MDLLKGLVIAAAIVAVVGWVYLLLTKRCWNCRHRLGRGALVCIQCGRSQDGAIRRKRFDR